MCFTIIVFFWGVEAVEALRIGNCAFLFLRSLHGMYSFTCPECNDRIWVSGMNLGIPLKDRGWFIGLLRTSKFTTIFSGPSCLKHLALDEEAPCRLFFQVTCLLGMRLVARGSEPRAAVPNFLRRDGVLRPQGANAPGHRPLDAQK